MTINYRKYTAAVLNIGGEVDYSCQATTAGVTNATPDGNKVYTFCASGAGEFRETPDPQYTLPLKWISDWSSTGLNRYVHDHNGETVAFTLTLDPGDADYERTWTGNVVLKEPNDGGDVRTTETSEVTWNCIGVPDLAYGS